MEEMKRLLGKKVTVINEFNIDIEKANKRNQQKKDLHGPRDQWSTKLLVKKASSGSKSLALSIQKDNLSQQHDTGVVSNRKDSLTSKN